MTTEDKEQSLLDLQKTIGWGVLREFITTRQANIKDRLLTESDMDRVKLLQNEHKVLARVVSYVSTPGEHKEEDSR